MKIVFFASLREDLACSELLLEPDIAASLADIDALKQYLDVHFADRGDKLKADNILCAVNQIMKKTNVAISPNDEVAFYPPVSGG